jgi:non-specific serine/threonine protein kinase/serine/threonine-protein kinase
LEQIGEGGFGVVFLAEQQQPVRRKVALKVLKPGMDTRQVIARFEAERQALALMDHPNIARVLDGGQTAMGRPYFVMDLVKGLPITEYCDQNHLTLRERLELFRSVCQAVQHAHHKGIIHRDIKPSNVLVSRHDSTPVVKVIDFGIAKAMGQQLTDKTLFTNLAQLIGTPLYMSPEQAGMSDLDVDTRSDVYSLGVLLYELLTGTTPFDKVRLSNVNYDEMRRIIREEEPPRPSTRISTLGQTATAISARRQSDPNRLSRLIRGDLDWMVMKALEKDRNRRYETASAFAQDIERYLRDESVQARAPSAAYRLRKFVRRNQGPVLAATMVLLALGGGMIGTTLGLVQASEQRNSAQKAAEAEKKARETAEIREAEIKAVLEFVKNQILAAVRPEGDQWGLGREVTLRKAVEAALPFVATSFKDQPLIEARLRLTLGYSFSCLGEATIAAEQYQTAHVLYTQHLGSDHPDTLGSMSNLATCYDLLGRSTEAFTLREQTLALCKAKLGPDHPDTLASMRDLATSYYHLGQLTKARELREQTLALCKAKLGPDHPDTLASMHDLATTDMHFKRHAEALKLHEETLALRKAKLGPFHRDTLASMNSLANSYRDCDRKADALKLHEETLALMKGKLGPDHPYTLMSMNNLAISYTARGQHAEAVKLNEETLAFRKAKFAPDHPDTLRAMNNLGCG